MIWIRGIHSFQIESHKINHIFRPFPFYTCFSITNKVFFTPVLKDISFVYLFPFHIQKPCESLTSLLNCLEGIPRGYWDSYEGAIDESPVYTLISSYPQSEFNFFHFTSLKVFSIKYFLIILEISSIIS